MIESLRQNYFQISQILTFKLANIHFYILTNILLFVGMLCDCAGESLGRKVGYRVHIFSHVRPFYEQAVSDLDRKEIYA